jgi:creatinine amidohydrolase
LWHARQAVRLAFSFERNGWEEKIMEDKVFVLAEMTWPEAKEALAQARVALVPVGSFEQHGPNGTFEVDTGRAYGFGRLLAARMYPRAILVPAVNVGVSYHHMNFPGTITLRAKTFMAVLYDLVWSLQQHGLDRFLILNGHGGNIPALGVLVVKLREELGVKVAWTSFTSLGREVIEARVLSESKGHACEGEISQAMVLAPHTVRREALAPGAFKGYPYRHLGEGYNLGYAYRFDEITANGALGDATLANEALGREIVEAALEKAVEFLEDFIGGEEKA